MEVPVVMVGKIEDLYNCEPIVTEKTIGKDGTILTDTSIHEASIPKDADYTIVSEPIVSKKVLANGNSCTSVTETLACEEMITKDKDTIVSNTFASKKAIAKDKTGNIVAKPLINKEALINEKDCTNVSETLTCIHSTKAMAKDNDCTIVADTLSVEKTKVKGKNSTVVSEILTRQVRMPKDKDCIIAARTSKHSVKAMAKDNDCQVSATFVNTLPIDDTEIDKNYPVVADNLIIEKGMDKEKYCAVVVETLKTEEIKAKDKNCTIVPKTLSELESIVKDNICTIFSPVISKSSPCSTQNINSLNEINKENKQLTDPVRKHTEPTSIIIDENTERDYDCIIIDNDNISKHPNANENTSHCKNVLCYDEIYKENRLLTDLIEKCLDMENSKGMLRVINRTVLPVYKNADAAYKKSASFEKALTQTIINLDTAPYKKFAHIKHFVELLKASKERKRVSLVTLKKNLNGKFSKSKNKFSVDEVPRKKKKIDIINLDDDDDGVHIDSNSDMDIQISDVGQVIEVEPSSLQDDDCFETNVEINDTDDSDVQINEQSDKVTAEKNHNGDVILIDDENINSNKENKTSATSKTAKRHKVKRNTQFSKRKQLFNANNNVAEPIDLCGETDEIANCNKVFNSGDVSKTISVLEEQIAVYNKIIQKLDEAEMTDDDLTSPYLKSEVFKQKVVSLYKELCRLTGTESVKRHKVRLTVAAGHHEGPARSLEQFINDNIGENGEPPFPDMHDVIFCVQRANTEFNMGWSKSKIDSEARALFIHYGCTVQKKRQKREWRHLMRYVKEKVPDPADADPELEARLSQNSVIAKRNEDELIERFVQMENCNQNSGIRVEIDESDESTSPSPSVANLGTVTNSADNAHIHSIRLNSYQECSSSGNLTNNLVMYNPCQVPAGVQTSQTIELRPVSNLDVNSNMESIPTYVTGMENNLDLIFSDDETRVSSVTDTQPNLNISSNIKVSVASIDKQLNIRAQEVTHTRVVNNCIYSNEVPMNCDACMPITNHVVTDKTNLTENNEAQNISKPCGSRETEEIGNVDTGTPQTDLNSVTVKRERLDIHNMLEQLGDNFTATVIDIEDPFMVIEISDSSESEDEGIQRHY